MNSLIWVLVVVGILWVAGLFFGVIGGVSKTFKSEPTLNINRSQTEQKQREQIQETELKRQRLMDDIQQKIKDQNHRY